ncbi:hypothetical protein Y1Q_0003108 [Alligator mississippiensis]|uniref:Uncharacterized protein n=1 Tax=Alligator mississippiensis TaxID=8496 RepID=A0A151MDG6_ALLMI|nr:hypothetical protein Y1Q_0003108 [Alligator mississippiensis]
MDCDPSLTVTQCWKDYTIAECIKNIRESLDEIKPLTMNARWKNLWRKAANDFCGFLKMQHKVEEITELGRRVGGEGFDDLQATEIEELIKFHTTKLNEEELEELIQSSTSDEHSEEEEVARKLQLTKKSLDKGF